FIEQASLDDVCLAVDFFHFLAFGDRRADAGFGEEGRDTGAAGADALGQRALRVEFELQLAGEVLLREQLVLADIGRDHLFDLPRLQQPAQPDAVDARIVGDDRQALDAGIAEYAAEPPAGRHLGLESVKKTLQVAWVGTGLTSAPPAPNNIDP